MRAVSRVGLWAFGLTIGLGIGRPSSSAAPAAEAPEPAGAVVSEEPPPALPQSGLSAEELGLVMQVKSFLESNPALACDPRLPFATADRVFVACGAQGALVFARGPQALILLQHLPVSGEAVGFFLHDGRVWVRVFEERAEVVAGSGRGTSTLPPLAPLPGQGQPAPRPAPGVDAPPPATAGESVKEVPTAAVGVVLAVDGLRATINIGSNSGLTLQSRVVVRTAAEVSQSGVQARPTVVVGRVVELEEGTAEVRFGVNEMVKPGASVWLTEDSATASRVAPERVTDVWELRGILRPMLNLGSFGGGALAEVHAGRRSRYFHYGATLAPLGVAGADGVNAVTTWQAYAFGAFDTWIFSAGLGVGAQAVNDTGFRTQAGSGLTLVQLLRVGALDGLHLAARTSAVIFHSETEFSGLEMQGQLSVAQDSWLIFRGGGGSQGYGFGEVAVRNLLSGNGREGSVFLEISVGGAALYEQSCPTDVLVTASSACQDILIGGPLVGLGTEWRL